MSLSIQQWAQYLPHGITVQYLEKTKHNLIGMSNPYGDCLKLQLIGTPVWPDSKDCKPLLTPIYFLSDEDAIMISEMVGKPAPIKMVKNDVTSTIYLTFKEADPDTNTKPEWMVIKDTPGGLVLTLDAHTVYKERNQIMEYLLSKHYAIGISEEEYVTKNK